MFILFFLFCYINLFYTQIYISSHEIANVNTHLQKNCVNINSNLLSCNVNNTNIGVGFQKLKDWHLIKLKIMQIKKSIWNSLQSFIQKKPQIVFLKMILFCLFYKTIHVGFFVWENRESKQCLWPFSVLQLGS